MRTSRVLALGVSMLVLLSACSTGGGASPSAAAPSTPPRAVHPPASSRRRPPPRQPIRIGSDNFYESELMGEIYAQVLENDGYTVERKFGLGSRQERIPTMDAGQVDLVPEYVGSGLGFYDKTKITGDGQANADGAPGGPDAEGHHGPRDHARRGHQRLRRPQGHVGQRSG